RTVGPVPDQTGRRVSPGECQGLQKRKRTAEYVTAREHQKTGLRVDRVLGEQQGRGDEIGSAQNRLKDRDESIDLAQLDIRNRRDGKRDDGEEDDDDKRRSALRGGRRHRRDRNGKIEIRVFRKRPGSVWRHQIPPAERTLAPSIA